MNPRRLGLGVKALSELGLSQTTQYALYRLLLRGGWLRRATSRSLQKTLTAYNQTQSPAPSLQSLLTLPTAERLEDALDKYGCARLLEQADEIAAGKVRLFGGEPRPLSLTPKGELEDWDAYELENVSEGSGAEGSGAESSGEDIKFTWEPARFSWAFTLGRAYLLSGDERYPQAFWQYWELFTRSNPAYRGPNWSSAQEAALRILAFVFAGQVFAGSIHSTPLRIADLAKSVAVHAARIPPTMLYGRAQNNNHLLSESAGLYTAGLALPGHPLARDWRELGWRSFHAGLSRQISPQGVYSQHSTSYHRLMLQLALWIRLLSGGEGRAFPQLSIHRLSAAARWLLALLDQTSGGVPNLGPQDGAYILPLTGRPQADYRPVGESAAAAFLGERVFPDREWDEMAAWFQVDRPGHGHKHITGKTQDTNEPLTLGPIVEDGPWAYLRAARFTGRPGHADQLHLDVWWHGMNVIQDAGTYLYNAPEPWNNALARSGVHNTLTVNGQEQMTWAGRFLWLDRAQAQVIERDAAPDGSWTRATAEHDGYRRLSLTHRRTVILFQEGRIRVVDSVYPISGKAPQPIGRTSKVPVEWHWLFPDWEWHLAEVGYTVFTIKLRSPHGPIRISVQPTEVGQQDPPTDDRLLLRAALIRAGTSVWGENMADPTRGWTSPTYGQKIPALSLVVSTQAPPPVLLATEFHFSNHQTL